MQKHDNLEQEKRWPYDHRAMLFFLRPPHAHLIALPPVNITHLASSLATNFTQTEKLGNETWNNLNSYIKANTIMIDCLTKTQDLSIRQASQRLVTDKRALHRLLPLFKREDLQAVWDGIFLSQQQAINTELNIKKYIDENIESSYQETLDYSLSLFQQPQNYSISIAEIRLYYLGEVLNNWIDWNRAKFQLKDALQVLKAILSRYARPFPHDFFQQAFDIERFPNIRFLDEAALLWNQLQTGDMFHGIKKDGHLSSFILEHNYFHVLSGANYRQKIIDKLFLPIINSTSPTIYFNGISFKNAQGKSFQDLINCTELEAIPEYKNLTFSQRQSLLKQKFYQIGESTEYKIGSLLHSLASSLLRIFYYQIAALQYEHNHSQKQLFELFKLSEEQWKEKKNYPIQPRLLLALHLAESNNVILSGDWQSRLKQLFFYLNQEFEKVVIQPPQFDRVKTAIVILNSKGMSLEEINKKRYYVMDADNPDLAMTYYGTPLEQFLRIADWDGIIGKEMYHQEVKIEPRQALQQAEEHFNSQLYQDPWVQNKAIDNLKHQYNQTTAIAIEEEARRIALNYATETENHRAWIRGLKVWIGTIPVIGPLYSIEEGIRDRDPIEIISGVFFLTLDAFDLLSGSEKASPDVASNARGTRLSIRERVTIDTVHSSHKKLALSSTDLPLDDQMILTGDPFSINYFNEVPSAYRLSAEQVRSGVQDLTWRDYPLIHLADENRVVPVKSEGGTFREINWYTGEVDPKKHLIYKDSETGRYYARSGLKGGNPDRLELSKEELRERITIKDTEEVFTEANDYIQYNFDRLFSQCFAVEQPRYSLLKAQDFYRSIYQSSPSFRRIFNRYHENFVENNAEIKWRIKIEANTISRTEFESNRIYIGSDAEIASIHYVSKDNNFEPSQPEQIYLHEMLHALTGKDDPLKAVSMRHRGTVVYLTDKILSEVGYVFAQRVMYRRLSQTFEDEMLEEANFRWSQYREEGKLLAMQENNYLDRRIDMQVPITEYKKVFGEDLQVRYTIKELDALWTRFGKGSATYEFNLSFNERFRECFTAVDAAVLDGLIKFYSNLYVRSREFAYLFDVWYAQLKIGRIKKWYFELNEKIARAELPADRQTHCINDLTRKIYIFDDNTYYLSTEGLLEVDRTQQLVHEMVQLLTGLNDPPADIALKNRGAVVQISSKIFAEAKFNIKKRLIYALATKDDFSKQALLLSNQLEVIRAVNLEDRLIKDMNLEQPLICAGCRKKRAVQKKQLLVAANDFTGQMFHRDENLLVEKEKIQKRLKKYGILPRSKLNDEKFLIAKKSKIGFPFFEKTSLSVFPDVSTANEVLFSGNHSLVS